MFYRLTLCRGFAFVVFQEEGAVQKVLDSTPHTIDGRQVDTKKAIPHAIHQVSSKVTLHAHTQVSPSHPHTLVPLPSHPHTLTSSLYSYSYSTHCIFWQFYGSTIFSLFLLDSCTLISPHMITFHTFTPSHPHT